MKIHSLKIEGITSIKDPIYLDFDKILEGHDLFAITGATGSGKSSILTSISLAFFGKGYKKIPVENYVSLGRSKANIELWFSTNYKLYKAVWSCKISTSSKSGKSRSETKRVLFDENGTALDKNADEIIGLTQEQFFKTVIISQGQFADFLTSSFTHRKKIIEQLYGTEELGLLSPILRRRIADIKIELELAQAKISGTHSYNEEDIQNFSSELVDISTRLQTEKENENFSHALNEQFKYFKQTRQKLDQHNDQISQTKLKLNHANDVYNKLLNEFNIFHELVANKKDAWKKDKELLRQAMELISPLKEKSKRFIELEKQVLEKKNYINDKTIIINDLTNEISNLSTQESVMCQKYSFKEISQENTKKYLDMLNKLEFVTNQLSNESVHIEKLKAELNQFNQHLSETNEKLLPLELDWESRKKELLFKKQEINKKIDDLNTSVEKIKSLTEKINDAETDHTKLIQKSINYKEQRISTREAMAELKEAIAALKLSHQEKVRTFAISLCQHENQTRNNCIVCEHEIIRKHTTNEIPFPEHIDQQLNDLESQLIRLQHNTENLENEISIVNELIATSQDKTEKYKTDIDLILNELSKNYEIKEALNTPVFFQSLKQLNQDELKQIENKLTTLTQDEQTAKHLIQKQAEFTQITINKKSDLNKLVINFNDLQTKHSHFLDNLQDCFALFGLSKDKLSEKMNHAKQLVSLTEEKSLKKSELNNIELTTVQMRQMLEKEEADLTNYRDEIKSIKANLQLIYPKYETEPPQQVQEERERELESLDVKRESMAKTLGDEEKKRNNFLQQISILSDNLKPLELHISEYVSRLLEMIHTLKEKQLDDENQIIEKLMNSISQLKSENALTLDSDIISYIDEILISWQQNLKDKISNLLITSSKLDTIISEYKNQQKEKQEILKQKEELNLQLARLDNLKEVMNNDGFSKFALSLLEEKLLIFTNKELETLCEGRYRLIEREISKRDGPEFFVIDLWQNGLERKVATLSGGETFLISLAMALSLAEMSRGQTDIDTFIIDEGFGTLDDESIEEVLDVLLSIRSRGKQIGLISHIKKLTERIPVNIQMQKIHQGNSQATVLYN